MASSTLWACNNNVWYVPPGAVLTRKTVEKTKEKEKIVYLIYCRITLPLKKILLRSKAQAPNQFDIVVDSGNLYQHFNVAS